MITINIVNFKCLTVYSLKSTSDNSIAQSGYSVGGGGDTTSCRRSEGAESARGATLKDHKIENK